MKPASRFLTSCAAALLLILLGGPAPGISAQDDRDRRQVTPGERGSAEQERARRLLEDDTPQRDIIVPGTPEQPTTNEADELIKRLGEQLKTQEKPPVTPPPPPYTPPENPPTYGPPENPPPYGPPEDPPHTYDKEKQPPPCCGMKDDLITYPITIDPMEIPKQPEAPHDPATGAYQVFLHNGAFFTNEVDLSLPAPAIPILWARHWRGKVEFKEGGLLGHGWDFSFNKRIVPIAKRQLPTRLYVETAGVDTPQLVFYDGLGHAETHLGSHSEKRQVRNFDRTFSAYVTTYRAPEGFFHEIERYIVLGPVETHPFREHPNVEKTERIFYVLREKNGTRYVFNCRGQLIYVLSRHDNNANAAQHVRLELRYFGRLNPLTYNRMLSDIIDPVGRAYKVETTTMGVGTVRTNIECRLVAATVPIPHVKSIAGSGLTVEYSYRGSQPILEAATVEGPGFTQRTEYGYDGAFRITSIKDANETAKGKDGKPYITNHYDGDGRVESQELGDIPFSIAYAGSGSSAPAATGGSTIPMTTSAPKGQAGGSVTVTDANGTERSYALTSAGGYPVLERSTIKAVDGRSWTTVLVHNDDSQIAKITDPRGNGQLFDYEPANRSVKIGPIRDWVDRDLTYENNLARGNLIRVTRFGLKDGESLVSEQTYDLLYNQPEGTTEPGGLKSSATYRYEVHGERGEPITTTQPSITRPNKTELARMPATYTYNFRGQAINVDLGDERVTKYTYNPGTAFLDRVDRPDRSYSTFVYDDRGNTTDEFGTRGHIHMAYDGRGLMTERTVDPEKAAVTTRYKYNPVGRPVRTEVTVSDLFALDEDAKSSPWNPPPTARPSYQRVVETEYDILNRPVSVTVTAGNERTYRKTEYSPDGTARRIRSSPLNGTDEYIVEYEYDPRGLPSKIISAAWTPTESVKTIAYDANGNQIDVIETEGAPPTHMDYDGLDRLTVETGTHGGTQRFEYNKRGHTTHVTVEGPTGPDEKSAVVYSADFLYDAYGNLARKAVDTLAGGTQITEWNYDRHLRLESTKAPNGGVTRFRYDLGDRARFVTDAIGNEAETVYDVAGRATKEIRRVKERHYIPAKNNYETKTATYETKADYDRLGRISAAYGPDGAVRERYLYDSEGNARIVSSAGKGRTEYIYDGLGRREQVRYPDGADTTKYTPGGLIAEYQSGTHHVKNEYDASGRRKREIDLNTSLASVFEYDNQGRALKTTDRNGTIVDFRYEKDGLRRIATVTPSGIVTQYKEDGQTREVPAVFGPKSEIFETDALGRLVSASSDYVKVTLAYDGLGHVVSETQMFEGKSETITRKFAPDLKWSEITYPAIAGGVVVKRQFDLLGRTTEIQLDGKPMARYAYTAPERMETRATANGWLTRFEYDKKERPVGISLGHHIAGNTYTTLWSQGMNYDDVGRMQNTTETHLPFGEQAGRTVKTAFAYDDHGRSVRSQTTQALLASDNSRPPESNDTSFGETGMLWGYDASGNLARVGEWIGGGAETSVAGVRSDTYTYDKGRITKVATKGRQDMVGKSVPTLNESDFTAFVKDLSDTISDTQEFTYDNQGNVIADGRFVYSYDYQGRLTRVVDRWSPFRYSETIRFRYDPLGRRIASMPLRDRVPGGVASWGSGFDRSKQRYLYDGASVIADVWLGPGAEPPDWDSPRTKSEPRLIARYFRGAREGEILRMDRRAENDPADDLGTLYLHQDMEGNVRFVSGPWYLYPIAINNAAPQPGSAAGTEIPPEDQLIAAGTKLRVPYINGHVRVDGFAGTHFREDTAAAPVDYRSAWRYAALQRNDALRAERLALQNRLQMEVGVYIAIMAAPAFAEGAGSLLTSLYDSGYVAGALQNAVVAGTSTVLNNTVAAIATHTPYSIHEAVADFSSTAGLALVMTGVGSGVGSLGLGKAGTFLANLAINNLGFPAVQGIMHGMDPSDAFAADARTRAKFTAADVGIGIIAPFARAALAQAGSKITTMYAKNPAAGGRPARSVQNSPHEIYVNAGREFVAQEHYQDAEVTAKTQDMEALDAGVMSALQKDGWIGRFVGWMIRTRWTNIAYYRNHPSAREADAQGYYSSVKDPRTVYINLDTLGWDPGSGVISLNRYKIASVVVHESMHALGGAEFQAFLAEAMYMSSIARRRNLGQAELVQWFGRSDSRLVNLYRVFTETRNANLFREVVRTGWRYKQHEMEIPAGAAEHHLISKEGGWAEFFGITDTGFNLFNWAAGHQPGLFIPKPP